MVEGLVSDIFDLEVSPGNPPYMSIPMLLRLVPLEKRIKSSLLKYYQVGCLSLLSKAFSHSFGASLTINLLPLHTQWYIMTAVRNKDFLKLRLTVISFSSTAYYKAERYGVLRGH